MKIRPERSGDIESIDKLTQDAFAPMPYSSGTEPAIIKALRAAGALSLSLVAVQAGDITGQITFSPVTIEGRDEGWFGLGPVAVRPAWQNQGHGAALVKAGLDIMKKRGARGCVLIGNPKYYCRFGFISTGKLIYGDVDPAYVQQLSFDASTAKGRLLYAPAFEAAA